MKTRTGHLALFMICSLLAAAPVGAATPGQWTLLGWNDLGMHCMDDSYAVFSILPPYNTIHAQLIDPSGKLVTSPGGITITWEAVADPQGSINTTSVGKTDFWDHVLDLFGASPAPDVGLTGSQMPGPGNAPQPMEWDPAWNWFTAEGIPLTPYDDDGLKNYYPMMRLVARDASGNVLATTRIVLPVSDEMDCRACHASGSSPDAIPGSGWVNDPDPIRDYKLNVLLKHDDMQGGTPTYQDALAAAGYDAAGLYETVVTGGIPVLCDRCHGSNALPGTGMDGIPPLTTAVHSGHAYVTDPATGMALEASANRTACYRCHPGSETRCLRGAMGHATAGDASLSIQCQNCHGSMTMVGSPARQGWFDEPTCQNCHTGTATQNSGQIRYLTAFDTPGHPRQPASDVFATDPDTPMAGSSLFRFSTGHGGLQCEACHGSTHAIFPSSHPNDNLQNEDLQGSAGTLAECSVCHGSQPSTVDGGPHGMHPVGQAWIEAHGDVAEGEGGGGGEGDDDAAGMLSAADGGSGAAQCQACHGVDWRGTVLSRALADRTVSAFGTKHFWKGYQVGCYTCHNGPGSEDANPNHPPQVSPVSASSGGEPVTLSLTANDSDGDSVTLRIVSQPAHGRAGISGTIATYVPDPGFSGTDTFTYAAWDGMADSNLGTVSIAVAGTGCSVACTASAPAAAAVGEPVAFSATATPNGCSGTPSYSWDFGDGTSGGSRNPTHTYGAPGTYTWRLTVTLEGASCSRSGSIVVSDGGGNGCSVTCTAAVPPTATVGEPLTFEAGADFSGECDGEPSYSWDFGDGTSGSGASTAHTYTSAGSYPWSLTVARGDGSCTSSGIVVVSRPGDDPITYMLVASHAQGVDDSEWRTDLVILNPAASPVDLAVSFADGGRLETRQVHLGPSSIREWIDVLKSLFGIGDTASGAVRLDASRAVMVSSRTYNDGGSGTFGQFFPAVDASASIGPGSTGYLSHLKGDEDFRSNIGILNLGADAATVRIRLWTDGGVPVGSPVERTVPGRQWAQINDIFSATGAGKHPLAWATVEVVTPGSRIWAYASVIDRHTNDPVTVPLSLSAAR